MPAQTQRLTSTTAASLFENPRLTSDGERTEILTRFLAQNAAQAFSDNAIENCRRVTADLSRLTENIDKLLLTGLLDSHWQARTGLRVFKRRQLRLLPTGNEISPPKF
jgi:hypothetical protein